MLSLSTSALGCIPRFPSLHCDLAVQALPPHTAYGLEAALVRYLTLFIAPFWVAGSAASFEHDPGLDQRRSGSSDTPGTLLYLYCCLQRVRTRPFDRCPDFRPSFRIRIFDLFELLESSCRNRQSQQIQKGSTCDESLRARVSSFAVGLLPPTLTLTDPCFTLLLDQPALRG